MPKYSAPPILPAPAENGNGYNLPVPMETYRALSGYAMEMEPEEPAVPLSQYFWILRRQWAKILSFVIFCMVSTGIVSKRITPVYEATATVDIDRQTPPGIIGQEAVRATTNDSDQFIATQVKLVQSDSVLRPVANLYKLRDFERSGSDATSANQAAEADAPVELKNLKITRPPNTYLLLIRYRSTDPRLAADVANAVARSYLEHTYNIRIRSSASLSSFMEKQLEELKAKMERSSSALAQFERELNVINPEEKTSILSSRLLQLNTEYTNAQTDRVRKETAYQSVKGGSLEAAQVSSQGDALKRLTERFDEAQQRFAEAKTHYGANHPEYRKLATQLAEVQRQLDKTRANIGQRVEVEYDEAVSRESMLNKAVADTKAEFDRLNARSFEYQALKRDAEADKKLYEELIRKIKEAGINAGFQNSAVRIADTARPPFKPVFPNISLNLALAFLFSTLLAVGAAVLADLLNNTVRDPEQVRRTLNTEVIGTLPSVKEWRGRTLSASGNGNGTALISVATPAAHTSLSGFDEAVRTLRNSILLADFDRRVRSLMVTSAAPSEGKSTIAAHLATAHAQQGRKTLLIDGDLRRPSVHRRFNLPGCHRSVQCLERRTRLALRLDPQRRIIGTRHLVGWPTLASRRRPDRDRPERYSGRSGEGVRPCHHRLTALVGFSRAPTNIDPCGWCCGDCDGWPDPPKGPGVGGCYPRPGPRQSCRYSPELDPRRFERWLLLSVLPLQVLQELPTECDVLARL